MPRNCRKGSNLSKIAERVLTDEGKVIVQEVHDFNPVLHQARQLRDLHGGVQGENRLVANVPLKLVYEWAKEAGLAFDDPALKDVVLRKVQDPAYSQFRVWGGTFQ